MKFSIKDFFSKCDQVRSFLRIWSHLLKKSLMENLLFCEVYCSSKILLTTERRLTGWYFLAVDLSPELLNTRTTDDTFQQSGKKDSFQDIFKSSANMYERSDSHFFIITTGAQSGPDTLEKLRLIVDFLTIFRSYRNIIRFKISSRRKK